MVVDPSAGSVSTIISIAWPTRWGLGATTIETRIGPGALSEARIRARPTKLK